MWLDQSHIEYIKYNDEIWLKSHWKLLLIQVAFENLIRDNRKHMPLDILLLNDFVNIEYKFLDKFVRCL